MVAPCIDYFFINTASSSTLNAFKSFSSFDIFLVQFRFVKKKKARLFTGSNIKINNKVFKKNNKFPYKTLHGMA